jgi:pimeloyl-ACP methyl ester carboxylesterase
MNPSSPKTQTALAIFLQMPHVLVDNDQINLHYKIFGSGPIRVLFIHGLATPMGDWKRQIEFFTKKPEYQIALLDNRGVGMSTAPIGFYSLVTWCSKLTL